VRFDIYVKNLFDNRTPANVTRFFDASTRFMSRAFLITLPKGRQFGAGVSYVF